MKYVAFLRGINVGGNAKVSMAELKVLFESLGFRNVKTLLNSGNVVFEVKDEGRRMRDDLQTSTEKSLLKTFKFPIDIFVYPIEDIHHLIVCDPFKDVQITENTRLYITFVRSENSSQKIKTPYVSEDKLFRILEVNNGIAASVVELNPQKGTTDAMTFLAKVFGRTITTRNWNTILKVANL